MIVEWLTNFVLDVVTAFFAALPLPELELEGFSGAFAAMGALDAAFPVSEAVAGFLVILGVTGAVFLVKIAQTLIAHIPMVGGGGA